MGKKTKIGKQRKDKYYQLAKETGYRSRAAFKLIQLNRKFGFLQRAQVCIDLCAAPGGWMQVAEKNMPASAVIVGVDLFPIPPIPRCISLVEDITTDKCRLALSKTLKTRKADVILNDGAPNVGKHWVHDAYQQITLTLSAVKLATQFLRPGGTFVTKVFRSSDYNALIWVLKQLFKKAHATKPQASRMESAEIFVVCEGYLAPDKIDPKLLDPKHVFAEIEVKAKNAFSIFKTETKKKKATGYADGEQSVYRKISAKDFISDSKPIMMLQDVSSIVLDDEWILNHPKTTEDIKENCKDIKVLGKAEIKALLNWWKYLNGDKKKEAAENVEEVVETEQEKVLTVEEEEDFEEEQIQEEIMKLKAEEAKDLKKKRKKVLKDRQKLNEKMNLKMVVQGDEGPKEEENEIFSLDQIKTMEHLKTVTDQNPDVLAESEADSDDEMPVKKKEYYNTESTHLDSSGLYYKSDESEEEESEENDSEDDGSGLGLEDSEDENKENKKRKKRVNPKYDGEDVESSNPLIRDLDNRDKKSKRLQKAELWFEKDIFKNLEDEKDEDFEIDRLAEIYKKKGGRIIGDDDDKMDVDSDGTTDSEDDNKVVNNEDKEDEESDSDYDIEKMVPMKEKVKEGFEVVSKKDTEKPKLKKRKLTEQELALGSLLAESKKSRRDVIDAAWNRYAFNDDHLPDWFVEDEKKHMRKETPVPAEAVEEYKKRVEELNVRPIKKVMEAKARKKLRAVRKLEKAKKKSEQILENQALTDHEKTKQIKSLYKKAQVKPKKEVKYVVVKKSMAQKRIPRPKGVVGKYRLVDPRMKKDLKAMKNKEKTKKRGKKGTKAKGGKNAKKGKQSKK